MVLDAATRRHRRVRGMERLRLLLMILFLRGTSATFVMSSQLLHKHDQRGNQHSHEEWTCNNKGSSNRNEQQCDEHFTHVCASPHGLQHLRPLEMPFLRHKIFETQNRARSPKPQTLTSPQIRNINPKRRPKARMPSGGRP